MNRGVRRAFYKKTAHLSLEGLAMPAWHFVLRYAASLQWSESEREVEREILEAGGNGQEFYHGGLSGRSEGDLILPGTETGEHPHNWLDPDWKRCRVYVTPAIEKARQYATDCDGSVYRVRLNGALGVDVHDVRTLMLVVGSPQFKAYRRVIDAEEARSHLIQNMPVSMTCDSATVLEVLE